MDTHKLITEIESFITQRNGEGLIVFCSKKSLKSNIDSERLIKMVTESVQFSNSKLGTNFSFQEHLIKVIDSDSIPESTLIDLLGVAFIPSLMIFSNHEFVNLIPFLFDETIL